MATGVTTDDDNAALVALGDLDALIDHVGRLCAVGDWEGLWDLRHRCQQAHERGQQLWPIASLVEYRCALEGPGAWAARALDEGAGHWTLGPLPEVAASRHTFAELAPFLTPGPPAAQFARECAAAGADLDGADGDLGRHLLVNHDGVPLHRCSWEPPYPTPTYHPANAEFPAPVLLPPDAFGPAEFPSDAAAVVEDPLATSALRELTAGWAAGWEAGASARVVAVTGDVHGAIARVCPTAERLAPLEHTTALDLMVWAAASGAATGRRRGLAAGRFDAWWAVVALGGASDDWPLPPEEVGELVTSLRWYTFDDPAHPSGWHLRLAAADPSDHLAWAIDARCDD